VGEIAEDTSTNWCLIALVHWDSTIERFFYNLTSGIMRHKLGNIIQDMLWKRWALFREIKVGYERVTVFLAVIVLLIFLGSSKNVVTQTNRTLKKVLFAPLVLEF